MFPARAGMSRRHTPPTTKDGDVPRASGDEPNELILWQQEHECSPRERG